MSLKRIALGTAAYTVVTFPLAVVWHVGLFERQYRAFGYFEEEPSFALGLLTILIQGAVLSVLYPRVSLAGSGLAHQRTTASPDRPARNALLVASRWPLRRLSPQAAPDEPSRWLPVRVGAPEPLVLGAMHIPNRDSGRKYPFHDALVSLASRWGRRPGMLVGDTNTGWPELDEQVPCWWG